MLFGFDFKQWIISLLDGTLAALGGPFQPLEDLVTNTPLALTTHNPIVQQAWSVMALTADSLLGIFVVLGVIRIMCSQSTGTLEMPIGEFLARAVLTVILIHLSAFFGEQLLRLDNSLSEIVQGNINSFILRFNNGHLFDALTSILISIGLMMVFLFTLFRVIFQAVKRLIRFNVLFSLSGLALLTSYHPYSSPICVIWGRMFIATIFEQFLVDFTFGLGFQFFIAIRLTGLIGFVIATAMLTMTAEIPPILSRLSATAGGGGGGGLGALVGTTIKVSALFI